VVEAGVTVAAVPLVTGILPGAITPAPLAKTGVKVVLAPSGIAAGLAVKLAMVGGKTVTVTDCVIAVPLAGVTERV